MSFPNILQSFHLEGMPLSGRGVRLGTVVQDILEKHQYPEAINHLLAQMMALAAVLSGNFKFTGKLTLQVKGHKSPLQSAVVEVTHDGEVRAYARFDEEDVVGKDFKALVGQGLMIFNLDQGDQMGPYQGIVALTGNTLQDAIEHYWMQSEQFRAAIFLGARIREDHWESGALVIHQLPGGTNDQWNHALALLRTLKADEFLDPNLSLPDLMYRLFHDQGIHILAGTPLKAKCRCTADKLRIVFKQFSKEDLRSILVENLVTATCEFCNTSYQFTKKELDL